MRALFISSIALLLSGCLSSTDLPTQYSKNQQSKTVDTSPVPSRMQGMLYVHNRARHELGLPLLKWSDHLSEYSQEWANTLATKAACKMVHRTEANADALKYGENLYWASPEEWSDGRNLLQKISSADVAQAWADEKKDYSYDSNSCREGEQCGHYTQMIWRTTTHVGCAMSTCPNNAQLWVCSYNPAGNWQGKRPY